MYMAAGTSWISSKARRGYVEISANLVDKGIEHFAMTGDSGHFLRGTIDVYGVVAAFAEKYAAVIAQVAYQIDALHTLISMGSRMTLAPASSS